MKAIVLGDIHFPYHHRESLRKVIKEIGREQPDYIIQIGDLYDQYAFSRFARKNITLPQQELESARHFGQKMWAEIRAVSPKSKCVQLLGNHDVRLIKRAEEKIPEAQELVKATLLELYRFDGVKTIEDEREEFELEGIVFLHGYRNRLGDHRDYNLAHTVCGHSHIGGVVFRQHRRQIYWELNVGYLADQSKEPLRYGQQGFRKWTLGYGIITKADGLFRPQFVPLE